MTPDLQFRRRPLSFGAMCAYQTARLVIPTVGAALVAGAVLTDLGLGAVVDWVANGTWDVWILAIYITAGIVSVPFTVLGWALVALHVTGRKA